MRGPPLAGVEQECGRRRYVDGLPGPGKRILDPEPAARRDELGREWEAGEASAHLRLHRVRHLGVTFSAGQLQAFRARRHLGDVERKMKRLDALRRGGAPAKPHAGIPLATASAAAGRGNGHEDDTEAGEQAGHGRWIVSQTPSPYGSGGPSRGRALYETLSL